MGINPLHFNGITSQYTSTVCEDVWFQVAWQSANRVSREDLAQAIQDAEQMLAGYAGYHLLPDWVRDERHSTVRPAMPELYNLTGGNVRGQAKSLALRRGYVIAGGVKARTLVTAGLAVTYSDEDGDGYKETATATATTTVVACQVRAFFPVSAIGAEFAGTDEWEIRPIRVTDNGATVTIRFRREQLPDPDLWERLNADSIDGDVDANFLTTVDVYRVWNDPQTQASFLWLNPDCSNCGGSGCVACELATQAGCLTVRNTRLGLAAYSPGTWDATDEEFDAEEWAECREPDRARVWYYSGWRDERRPCPETTLDPYWERAIAYLATAILNRDFCSCNNVQHFAAAWREDLARSGREVSYQNTASLLNCPFGTTRGAQYAWNAVNQEGRRIA